VDQAVGIIGQAVLVVMGLVLLAFLLLLLFAIIRAIKRMLHDLRQPLLPETDAYIPEPFELLLRQAARSRGTPRHRSA
jgi:hypothetical protein